MFEKKEMDSKNFLLKKLGELHHKFPGISIKYQFDGYTRNHIVEVLPVDDFEGNADYMACESDLCFEFDNMFFPESVMFVSEDSLTRVTVPEMEFYPILAKWFVNTGYTVNRKFKFNDVVSQHNYITSNKALAA